MGSLTRKIVFKGGNEFTNKIPEYAKDFKREWQYIRGINKTCEIFLKKIVSTSGEIFNSPIANRIKYDIKNFLKAQERGRLKDISNFCFSFIDANNIECLEEQMSYYTDLYVDDSFQFNDEYYELNVDRDYPGFKELIGLVSILNDMIKKEDPIVRFESDSDSETEDYYNDLNDFMNFFNRAIKVSDSDSDSD